MDRYSKRTHQRPSGWTYTPRLMTMLLMLLVVGMLMYRSADPNMWKWFATAPEASDKVARPAKAETVDPEIARPRGKDRVEQQQIEDDLSTVQDKTQLGTLDMRAYWSMLEWSRRLPFDELRKHANADVRFKQIWEEPDKWRGQLVELRLNVRDVTRWDLEQNPENVPTVYEALGWTDESGSNPYLVIFKELPEGMEIGPDVREDVTFVGYFLKLMYFKSRDNKFRAAPLLIGRVIRHENAAALSAKDQDEKNRSEFWITIGIGGALIVMMIISGSRIFRRRKPIASSTAERPPEDAAATGDWLINLPAQDSGSTATPENPTGNPPDNRPTP